ncbi:hypothetical protein AWENTII_000760 [Aspergillus wentii]
MVFFNSHWDEIGTKASLQRIISQVTGIPSGVVLFNDPTASVAQRMSWASGRQTSRLEDRAYSLMGLFGVHMPMIYGEGEMAFQRLQLEIMKVSSDQTLFARTTRNPELRRRVIDATDPDRDEARNVLATCPEDFGNCREMNERGRRELSGEVLQTREPSRPYEMTNAGLHIKLPLIELPAIEGQPDKALGVLGCHSHPPRQGDPTGLRAILLQRATEGGPSQYIKIEDARPLTSDEKKSARANPTHRR